MTKKPLIVGIDPGNTSAVAAFNLDGELEFLESKKEFGTDEMIKLLVETGKPVVVASDREKIPSKVDKVARSLGARKFEPLKDLSTERKEKIGKGENSHEVDAYASGLYAYNSLQTQIRKIKRYAYENEEDIGAVAKRYFSNKQLEK